MKMIPGKFAVKIGISMALVFVFLSPVLAINRASGDSIAKGKAPAVGAKVGITGEQICQLNALIPVIQKFGPDFELIGRQASHFIEYKPLARRNLDGIFTIVADIEAAPDPLQELIVVHHSPKQNMNFISLADSGKWHFEGQDAETAVEQKFTDDDARRRLEESLRIFKEYFLHPDHKEWAIVFNEALFHKKIDRAHGFKPITQEEVNKGLYLAYEDKPILNEIARSRIVREVIVYPDSITVLLKRDLPLEGRDRFPVQVPSGRPVYYTVFNIPK